MAFCKKCGESIGEKVIVCPYCGNTQGDSSASSGYSPDRGIDFSDGITATSDTLLFDPDLNSSKSHIKALNSMICGIISTFFSFLSLLVPLIAIISIPIGIVAISFAAKTLPCLTSKGKPITGLVTGIIGVALGALALIILVIALAFTTVSVYEY